MTAVTTTAAGIAFGAYDVVIAAGVEHMGHHPIGEGVDPNPRFLAEKLVDPSALVMGQTAENLHDRFPHLTKERADAFAAASQAKLAKAYADGKVQPDLVPVATRSAERGWGLATADEPPRPGTTVEDLAELKTPFRPHGKVTAGNSAGLNDGATACLLAAADIAAELGMTPRMRLVSAFAGVEPEFMGVGPVPATDRALAQAGLSIDDVGLIEINEAFAVQVLAFLDHYGSPTTTRESTPSGARSRSAIRWRRRGAADEPAGAVVRGPPRGPVRHHHDVRRDRDGRHCRLGEPAARALRQQGGRLMTTIETVDFPAEVVTKALVRFVELPLQAGKAALITLDNGHDHTKPNTLGRPAFENSIGRSPRHTPSLAWSPSASPASPSSSPPAPTSRAWRW